ncbi:MAG: A24 family peptidase [Sutterellaceae bacterium]|nr:A24 family peptidase [Burkholderiaceae bacterium]MCX7900934.1 A24 family peptidase [Burkholderiaceae bacterium]MDW8429382.1 A24 family peptidase [Sutterellaceae bacterium]
MSADTIFLLCATACGLAVGSFLNVVIHRLPRMMEADWRAHCAELEGRPQAPVSVPYNLWTPRSHCPTCRTPLRVRDNIPLVSYLWLRGRCAHCGARISPRYPAVEALSAALSALVAWRFGFSAAAALALIFTWTLIAASFIDADTTLLPDQLTLPLLWLGLLANLSAVFAPLADAVIGAAAGYVVLWSIYWLFKLATGKEGMGYGDFKLLAALGAWMGWKMLLPILLLSSLVAAIVGIALIALAQRGREVPIAFGPYLAAAGFVALLYGDTLASRLLPF